MGRGDDGIDVSVDQVLLEDVTGTMACLQFERLGIDRVRTPIAVSYIDHNVLQIDERNSDDHVYLRTFAERYGMLYSRPGNGISHYLHLERYARPGDVLVGADSHTTTAGGLGMLAIGAGATEVAVVMGGRPYALPTPVVVGVRLQGELQPWVEAKDVILELLRRRGVRGGRGRIFEFHGPGVAAIAASGRATICNMIVETGATTALFPSDAQTERWLAEQGRAEEFRPLAADEGAAYDEVEEIDLGALEPLIAMPQSPGNVVPVREVAGREARQVCVGSSVNSSYEDLATVAAVLRETTVHHGLDLTITPGSRQILDTIARSGVYADLLRAGGRMLEPACGPCIGMGQAPASGTLSVRTFNRNFPGRSGTLNDAVCLCSPSTAAATALRGVITDPRDLGEPPALSAAAAPDLAIDQRQIVVPPPAGETRAVEVVRPSNIEGPPDVPELPNALAGRTLIVLPDDVSTGDMAPDGALGLAIWSNIPACAARMFRRFDREFPARATEWGGGVVVAGDNYGQGSSREQAAFAALHLGVRAVVAKGFARIHRSNLIAQAILPLVFEDPDDFERVELGSTWRLEDVRAAVAGGAGRIAGELDGATVALLAEFTV
ncbi:MAG: aconitate hydratase, partial [Gaiellaceae bacterium]|nr:aconitate hydratase [Gaiellaceae bacterium]